MADRFILCGRCSRHVKACEAACPFCGDALAMARPSTGEPFRRMAAAAAVAAGVAAVTGCSSNSSTSAVANDGSVGLLDSGGDGANNVSEDGAPDAPSVGVFYGFANPLDAGANQADGPKIFPADSGGDGSDDAPSAVAFYGNANPIDASTG